MKREKKYLMYGIALIMLILVGVSLAYFSTVIAGDKKEISVDFTDLKVVFNGSNDITGTDIEPEWSDTITFSVENKTKREYNYNIVLENFVNTFKTSGYLVYKITSTDGGYNMDDYEDVIKRRKVADTIFAYNILIEGNTKHNYTLEIKYIDSEDVDQSDDMNSELSGKLYIKIGTEEPSQFIRKILTDNYIIEERTDFSVTNIENTTGTIYKTNKTEDDSEVYYYSGNTTNNWVKFGKYSNDGPAIGHYSATIINRKVYNSLEECNSASSYNYNCHYLYQIGDDIYWRIIRTNEDGSVRLLYAGTSTDTTEGYIGASVFNENDYESRYVGYMYGENTSLAENRTNTTNSTIKTYLDAWYQTNLLTNYDKYISKSAIYCNDRSIGSGTWSNAGSKKFYFGAYTRLVSNKAPNYKCGANASDGLFSTASNTDKFSASTTGGGNGQLTYPIALMTADEVSFAGGKDYTDLSSPYAYYYTNSLGSSISSYYWWLLSPSHWWTSGSISADAFSANSSLNTSINASVCSSKKVRPVISISSCAKVTGTGTPEDPYVIDEINSTC